MEASKPLRRTVRRRILLPLSDMLSKSRTAYWLDLLTNSQYWDITKLQRFQKRKLKALLNYAIHHVPLYKKIKRPRLMDFPVIDKSELIKNRQLYLSDEYQRIPRKVEHTGGSTGKPFTFYVDLETWGLLRAANIRSWKWSGYSYGDPIAFLGGSSVVPLNFSIKRYLKNIVDNVHPISTHNLNDKSIEDILQKLSFEPSLIYGYASSIYLIACYILDHNVSVDNFFSRLQAIYTTAEVLLEKQREVIMDVFNVPTISIYGARDGSQHASECPLLEGFHISPESAFWEILDKDNEPVGEGEEGEIVVTSLTNRSMPFIRYRTGDIATYDMHRGKCRVNLPLISKIKGRVYEFIITPNGDRIHGDYFNVLFSTIKNIKEYQIKQTKLDRVDVYLVPWPTTEDQILQLERNVRIALNFLERAGVKVNIRILNRIDLEGKKYRPVISRVFERWIKKY